MIAPAWDDAMDIFSSRRDAKAWDAGRLRWEEVWVGGENEENEGGIWGKVSANGGLATSSTGSLSITELSTFHISNIWSSK